MTHRPKRNVFTSTAHLFEDKLGVPATHLAQGGRGNIRAVATTKLPVSYTHLTLPTNREV